MNFDEKLYKQIEKRSKNKISKIIEYKPKKRITVEAVTAKVEPSTYLSFMILLCTSFTTIEV